jgi:hypothetical protein
VLNILSLVRGSDFLRVTTDAVLGGASKQCPHHAKYDPTFSYGDYFVDSVGQGASQEISRRDEKVVYFNVSNAVLSILMIVAFYAVKSVARCRYRGWRDTLSDEAFARLRLREDSKQRRDDDLNFSTQPMFRSRQVPRQVRILVPVALVTTVGIQLVGHLAVLFTVNIEGQIAGELFTIDDFLTFKFINASLRTYRNGGNEMSILLFVFTGIWPYLKLFTCLILWFVSPLRVSVTKRGTLLLWLDVFAKLSIVDILTTLLAVATFLVYIGGVAESEISTGEFFATRIITVPRAGCYCIVIAQRLTRISSTYLLDWHNQIVDAASLANREWKQMEDTMTATTSPNLSMRSLRQVEFSQNDETMSVAASADPFEDENERQRLYDEIQQLEAALKSYHARSLPVVEASEESFTLSPDRTLEENHQNVESEENPSELASNFDSDTSFDANLESSFGVLRETDCVVNGALNTEVHEIKEISNWRRLAATMTGFTVLALAVMGCIMAPSMSVDARSLWGIFESGQTFTEAVTGYSLFRVICSILVQARFVLDSAKARAGLGMLLALIVVTATGVPITKVVSSIRAWYQNREAATETPNLDNTEQSVASRNKQFLTWCYDVYTTSVVGLMRLPSLVQYRCASRKDDDCEKSETANLDSTMRRRHLARLKRLPAHVRRGYAASIMWLKRLPPSLRRKPHSTKGGSAEPSAQLCMDLLPAYQWKAWRHLEVYVLAFVIAIWQLGAVAAYVIQQYCSLLEMCFDMLVFLGLVESTSKNCFREQASSPSTLLILFSAFLALLVSFLWEAVGQYRKVVAKELTDTSV